MPTQHLTVPTLPELAREHRALLWSRSIGIWIGLGLALLVFGNVISITTINTPYIGQIINFVLGWGGLLVALASVIYLFVTLSRLRTNALIDAAIHQERLRVASVKKD